MEDVLGTRHGNIPNTFSSSQVILRHPSEGFHPVHVFILKQQLWERVRELSGTCRTTL